MEEWERGRRERVGNKTNDYRLPGATVYYCLCAGTFNSSVSSCFFILILILTDVIRLVLSYQRTYY